MTLGKKMELASINGGSINAGKFSSVS